VLCTFQRVVQKYWFGHKSLIRKGAAAVILDSAYMNIENKEDDRDKKTDVDNISDQKSETKNEDTNGSDIKDTVKISATNEKQSAASANICTRIGNVFASSFRSIGSWIRSISFQFVTSFFEVCYNSMFVTLPRLLVSQCEPCHFRTGVSLSQRYSYSSRHITTPTSSLLCMCLWFVCYLCGGDEKVSIKHGRSWSSFCF